MRYNTLGRTGLVVSELCLGAMTFGTRISRFGTRHELDQEASTAIVKQAFDAGINFIDTANVYSDGQSEEFVGGAIKALGLKRSDIVIATKGHGVMGDGPNDRGTGRKHLLAQIDESLDRLGVEYVDLYQAHGWDAVTPLAETLEGLNDIVRSGRARYVGVSNWAAWHVAKARGIAENRGWAKPISVQAYYTVASRELERELGPMMLSEGVGLMVYSPLAGGLLSGKYIRGEDGMPVGEGRRKTLNFTPIDQDRDWAIVELLKDIAAARGATPSQVALAWLLHQPVVSSVIVGASRADQLADNLGSTDLELTSEELERLSAMGVPRTEYPGWALATAPRNTAARISPRRTGG